MVDPWALASGTLEFDPFFWLPLPFPWYVKAAVAWAVFWIATGGLDREHPD